jgi:large subunit ribosomal protein L29
MKLEKDKKWKWPADKMKEWTDAELATRARDFSDQLGRLRFRRAGGQTESLAVVRDLRKGIARVKTIQRERQLSVEGSKSA